MKKQYWLLILGSTIISTFGIGIALAERLNPAEVTWLRMFWGLVGILIVAAPRLLKIKIKPKDLLAMITLGIVGQGCTTLFGSEAVKATTHLPSVLLIINTAPFMAYIGQVILRREKLNIKNLSVILLGIAGLSIILLDPNESINMSNNLSAYFYAWLNGLCIAIFGLFIGKYSKQYSTHTVLALALLSSTIVIGSLKASEINFTGIFDVYSILFGVFFGVITLLIPQTIRVSALEHIKTSTVLMFSLIIPISTTILSYFILDSEITIRFVIGALITLGSLALVIRSKG